MSTVLRRALGLAAAMGLAGLVSASTCEAGAGVLQKVRARGHLVCGIGEGRKGYSVADGEGSWSGIGVDFCRALAAAVLGNKDAVQFRVVSPAERDTVLQSGEADVLSGNAVLSSSSDTAPGTRFPGVLVYGGQGFLVRKAQGVASALELSGARICVSADTDDAQGIAEYFGGLRMPYELSKFDTWQNAVAGYADKTCQVLSGDVAALAAARQNLADAGEHIILPEYAARRLEGPAIRQGDENWFGIVRWVIYALVAAEELGVTSANADGLKASPNVRVRRFLGAHSDLGAHLGLAADWTHNVVRQVGNYGELFERHLGARSPLKLERGLNRLAGNGGLLYAPAFR